MCVRLFLFLVLVSALSDGENEVSNETKCLLSAMSMKINGTFSGLCSYGHMFRCMGMKGEVAKCMVGKEDFIKCVKNVINEDCNACICELLELLHFVPKQVVVPAPTHSEVSTNFRPREPKKEVLIYDISTEVPATTTPMEVPIFYLHTEVPTTIPPTEMPIFYLPTEVPATVPPTKVPAYIPPTTANNDNDEFIPFYVDDPTEEPKLLELDPWTEEGPNLYESDYYDYWIEPVIDIDTDLARDSRFTCSCPLLTAGCCIRVCNRNNANPVPVCWSQPVACDVLNYI